MEAPCFSPSTLHCAVFAQCSITATSGTTMHCDVEFCLWVATKDDIQRPMCSLSCPQQYMYKVPDPVEVMYRSSAINQQRAITHRFRTSKESAGQTHTIQPTENSTNVESQFLQRSQHQDGQVVLQLGKFIRRESNEFHDPIARLEGGRLLLLVSQLPKRDHR